MKIRTIALFSFIALVALAAAQKTPPGRELMITKRIFLALNSKIMAEIKMTADQHDKIMEAFDGVLEEDGDRIRIMLRGDQDLADMERNAVKVLNPTQQMRLEEIWIQRLNGVALADEKVANKVGITKDQAKQIDGLIDEGGKSIADLMSPNPDPEIDKQIAAIRLKCGKKIESLLTDPQKKTFEDLKGKPFDLKSLG